MNRCFCEIRIFMVLCAISLTMSLVSCSSEEQGPKDYELIHKVILQPVDHADPDGPKLEQQIDILIPNGVPPDSPVFFNLGNEQDIDEEYLIGLHEQHGNEHPIIYAQAEHRGYGQSLTMDKDQSVPEYVQIDQALADAHEVVQQLKKEFPGPWMGAGWSYGGGMIVEFAYKYPEDFEVILSSSGVFDWPFLNQTYDKQIREVFGKGCYKRLVNHSRNLKPSKLFDENWLEREFLYAIVMGLTQLEEFRSIVPYFKLLTFLPTNAFINILHRVDKKYGKGEAWEYANSLATKALSRKEAATGKYGWRVWRYQQCTELGTFYFSPGEDGLFYRSKEDFCQECQAIFDENPPYLDAPEWSQRAMLETLKVPMIYVSGAQDPWYAVGLASDYHIENGKYFFAPEGRHCPERSDPELSREVLAEMLKYALADS